MSAFAEDAAEGIADVERLRHFCEEDEACRLSDYKFSDAALSRWYESRGRDFEKTKKTILRHLQWRSEENVSAITEGEVNEEIETGKVVIGGEDNEGRVTIFIFVRKHDKDAVDQAVVKKFIIYILESALKKCHEKSTIPTTTSTTTADPSATIESSLNEPKSVGGNERLAIVFDLQGFSLQCMDYTAILCLIRILQYNYPFIIGRVSIVNSPWLFSACWVIIRRWLDPAAAAIVNFVSTQELEASIPKESIPETFYQSESDEEEDDDDGDGDEEDEIVQGDEALHAGSEDVKKA